MKASPPLSASDSTKSLPANAAPSQAVAGLDRLVTAFSRREQGYGLSPAQWSALRYIAAQDGPAGATTGETPFFDSGDDCYYLTFQSTDYHLQIAGVEDRLYQRLPEIQ